MPDAIRVAAALCWISGAGFGVFIPSAIRSVAAGRGVPVVFGFPAYGNGPFERVGIRTTVPLLAGFLLVCAGECLAGWMLGGGARRGAVLSFLLLPVGALYWWGFALPFPPVFALARTLLILSAWSRLR